MIDLDEGMTFDPINIMNPYFFFIVYNEYRVNIINKIIFI